MLHNTYSSLCLCLIQLFTKNYINCMLSNVSRLRFCAYCIVSLCNLPITSETPPCNPDIAMHNDCADTLDSCVPELQLYEKKIAKDLHISPLDYASRFSPTHLLPVETNTTSFLFHETIPSDVSHLV